MNNTELDLNITNYKLEEVEKLLKVTPPYSLNDVLKNERMITDVISKDKTYPVEKKARFIEFMKEAKLRLTQHMRKELDKMLRGENSLPEDEDDAIVKTNADRLVNKVRVTQSGGNSFVQHPATITHNDMADNTKRLQPMEVQQTDIARGDLNVLRRKSYTQTIVLNTIFREDYKNTSSADFMIILPYQFKNVISLKLSSLQLPNVIYCFSSDKMNNLMYIRETGDGDNKSGTIILPDGNYSLTSVAAILEREINKQLDIYPPRFFVDSDEATQKITIRNDICTFDINFLKGIESKDFNSTLGWLLGFREVEYSCSARYTGESVYVGTSTDYIFFVVNDYNNSQVQTILAMYSKSYIGDNILAVMPISTNNVSDNSFFFDSGSLFLVKKRDYFGPVNLQKFRIELRNQYGELVDLNLADYSFSLEVEIGYDW